MNIVRKALTTVIVSILPFALSAQTVYERTNEQGVVEFSDQPGEGAAAVKVTPNVIESAPTPEIETFQRPEKKQAAATTEPAPAVEVQVTPVHTNTNPRLRPTPLPSPGPRPSPAPAPR